MLLYEAEFLIIIQMNLGKHNQHRQAAVGLECGET